MAWNCLKEEQDLGAQTHEIVDRICKEDPRGALVDVVIEQVEGYTVGEVKRKWMSW